jgi:hypothetical protein
MTPRQRNGYDCGVFSILFALHIGLRLNINNINQTQIPAIRCQMLLHLLKIALAEDNNEVLPVRPAIRETNANNPLLLSDDSEDNSDGRSAHIDGVLDDNVRDDDENRPDASMDIADNNNGDKIAAAYDADGGEEDNASSANDNTNAGQEQAGNDKDVDGGQDNDDAGGDNNGSRDDDDAGGDNNNEPGDDNAGNNEDANGRQDNDQADNDGDAGEDGTNADSEDEEENEEGEVNLDEDDANVAASYQEAEDMDQLADSQLTFGSLSGALPPSQVYAGLIADMSPPASNVLSSPVASLAIQDHVLTSPVTSPVVASLSQFLSEDVSRSIEKQLIEAELLNAETQETLWEALIQAEVPDVPEESDSMLLIMPSLDHEDDQSEDKKEDKSPATDYRSSGFHDPYSDDDDSLLDDKKTIPKMIEECFDLLINLKSAGGPLTGKTKDKPTDKPINKKKPKSRRKQSRLPLQAPLSPEVEKTTKPKRRTSPRRAEALAKEAELARAEALARQASVAEEASTLLKKTPGPTKGEAVASLKNLQFIQRQP